MVCPRSMTWLWYLSTPVLILTFFSEIESLLLAQEIRLEKHSKTVMDGTEVSANVVTNEKKEKAMNSGAGQGQANYGGFRGNNQRGGRGFNKGRGSRYRNAGRFVLLALQQTWSCSQQLFP